jgi:hypothetical protein
VKNNTRILKYKDVSSTEDLKKSILNSLLLPINNDSFEDKIDRYLRRQPKLKIRLLINKDQIFRNIENHVTRRHSSRKIPDNYDFGNPQNRWIHENSSKPDKESLKEIIDLELEEMKSLFTILEQLFEVDYN